MSAGSRGRSKSPDRLNLIVQDTFVAMGSYSTADGTSDTTCEVWSSSWFAQRAHCHGCGKHQGAPMTPAGDYADVRRPMALYGAPAWAETLRASTVALLR